MFLNKLLIISLSTYISMKAFGSILAKSACADTGKSLCEEKKFRTLPNVRFISVCEESAPVAHSSVASVIGTETNFELLLPENWNGNFVMDDSNRYQHEGSNCQWALA